MINCRSKKSSPETDGKFIECRCSDSSYNRQVDKGAERVYRVVNVSRSNCTGLLSLFHFIVIVLRSNCTGSLSLFCYIVNVLWSNCTGSLSLFHFIVIVLQSNCTGSLSLFYFTVNILVRYHSFKDY